MGERLATYTTETDEPPAEGGELHDAIASLEAEPALSDRERVIEQYADVPMQYTVKGVTHTAHGSREAIALCVYLQNEKLTGEYLEIKFQEAAANYIADQQKELENQTKDTPADDNESTDTSSTPAEPQKEPVKDQPAVPQPETQAPAVASPREVAATEPPANIAQDPDSALPPAQRPAAKHEPTVSTPTLTQPEVRVPVTAMPPKPTPIAFEVGPEQPASIPEKTNPAHDAPVQELTETAPPLYTEEVIDAAEHDKHIDTTTPAPAEAHPAGITVSAIEEPAETDDIRDVREATEEYEPTDERTDDTENLIPSILEDEENTHDDNSMPPVEEVAVLGEELQTNEETAADPDAEHPITAIYSLEPAETEMTEDERDMVTHVKDLLEYFARRLDEPVPDKPEKIDLLLQCLRAQLDVIRQETEPEITEEALRETLEAILIEAGVEDAEHLARIYMQLYGIDELFDAHTTTAQAAAVNQQIIEQCRKLARMALRLFAHHETPQLADS